MEKKQDTFRRNILVLALVAVYFFTATTHIFCIPCMTQVDQHMPTASGNSIFKRKAEFLAMGVNQISLGQRTDKSTLEERKPVSDSIKLLLSFFTILLFVPLVWRMRPKFFTNISDWLIPSHHSYVSLCVIRI